MKKLVPKSRLKVPSYCRHPRIESKLPQRNFPFDAAATAVAIWKPGGVRPVPGKCVRVQCVSCHHRRQLDHQTEPKSFFHNRPANYSTDLLNTEGLDRAQLDPDHKRRNREDTITQTTCFLRRYSKNESPLKHAKTISSGVTYELIREVAKLGMVQSTVIVTESLNELCRNSSALSW